MDHETAVRLQASEAYVLGDLSTSQRDEFEEHFADCPECMDELWRASAFAANARAVFRERAAAAVQPARRWRDWLRWRPAPALAWSAALNLVLCAGLAYQLLRSPLRQAARPRAVEVIAVHSPVRGSGETAIAVSGPSVVLSFDLPRRYSRYTYTLRPVAGSRQPVTGDLAPGASADALNLEIPLAGLPPGEYTVAASGWDGGQSEMLGECRLRLRSH